MPARGLSGEAHNTFTQDEFQQAETGHNHNRGGSIPDSNLVYKEFQLHLYRKKLHKRMLVV